MAEIRTVLPPLPPPEFKYLSDTQSGITKYYSAEQMRAYAEAAVLSANAGKVDEDTPAADSPWRDQLEILLDMYEDNGKPDEERTYVYGSFDAQMKEIKSLIQANKEQL